MITLPLLFIAALYAALLIWVGRKLKTWPTRIVVLLVLLSPVIYGVGSYQYVHYRHEQDCAREGGLKVLIQPEKADRIRLDADHFDEAHARGLLYRHSPDLVMVEAWDGNYTAKGKTGYFAYAPDVATTALTNKERKYIKTPLVEPTEGLYVLSESSPLVDEVKTTTWTLSRNGQVYATWTMFYHFWSRNSAMNIGWQCFGPGSSEWKEKLSPFDALTALILK